MIRHVDELIRRLERARELTRDGAPGWIVRLLAELDAIERCAREALAVTQ
jgi:hypothetical protein